jgi:hypothetical protein
VTTVKRLKERIPVDILNAVLIQPLTIRSAAGGRKGEKGSTREGRKDEIKHHDQKTEIKRKYAQTTKCVCRLVRQILALLRSVSFCLEDFQHMMFMLV